MAKRNDLKTFTQIFGILLRKQREEGRHSQEEYSIKAGKHRQWVSKIENGETLPSIFSFYSYAKAVGIDAASFIQKAINEYEQEIAPAKVAAEHNQGLDYFIRNKRRKASNKD